jgi:hypothetical protein
MYHALDFIQGLYRFLAWASLVACIAGGLFVFFIGGEPSGVEAAVRLLALPVSVIVGGVLWVSLMAVAEVIAVVCNMEDNTRRATQALNRLAR